MQRVLFHSTIFGPIHSRRLGSSLGVNLSPVDGKICSFDCLYCEAGFNAQGPGTSGFPLRAKVAADLEAKLIAIRDGGEPLDVITFSGNGEPTLHPDFEGIIEDTIALRDLYAPSAQISVLSNSTMLGREAVDRALTRVDNNILKLDSAVERTMRLIDRPNSAGFDVKGVVERMKRFSGECIVQTMLIRGNYNGEHFDNTTDDEIDALIEAYRVISPRSIMLYSIDRKTPHDDLEKVNREDIERIARRLRAEGFDVSVA